MKKRITDPVEQWKALLALGRDDILEPDYPEHLVDEDLRDAGVEPREIEVSAKAFGERLVAERAEAATKVSMTRLRSTTKQPSSSVPPVREKAPSESEK